MIGRGSGSVSRRLCAGIADDAGADDDAVDDGRLAGPRGLMMHSNADVAGHSQPAMPAIQLPLNTSSMWPGCRRRVTFMLCDSAMHEMRSCRYRALHIMLRRPGAMDPDRTAGQCGPTTSSRRAHTASRSMVTHASIDAMLSRRLCFVLGVVWTPVLQLQRSSIAGEVPRR